MTQKNEYNNLTEYRNTTANKWFCASWARRIKPQHFCYYLASVPARQIAIRQNNKTST